MTTKTICDAERCGKEIVETGQNIVLTAGKNVFHFCNIQCLENSLLGRRE